MAATEQTPTVGLTAPLREHTTHTSNGTVHQSDTSAPDDGRYVSKAEYEALYYENGDANYEWNDGYLEAKPISSMIQGLKWVTRISVSVTGSL